MDVPWLVVAGFGAHIKSTRNTLFVQRNGVTEEYPLDSVRHLLIIGGHTVHTTVVTHLTKAGASISFFEADGRPSGTIRPFNDQEQAELSLIQKSVPGHRYAVTIARASMQSKTLLIGQISEESKTDLFYAGEADLFTNSQAELEYLVRMSEIRRIHRLTSDMYYEVLSRTVPRELSYRRRTERPYRDPVNAILAFGYAMLFGNVMFSVTGAHLDPESGTLNRGPNALIYDIMEPFKASMIDREAVRFIRDRVTEEDYDCGPTRCILSDPCMKELIALFHGSISQDKIDHQVAAYRESLLNKTEYRVQPV
ncbi:MAG TPA: CRISPR-associated endonuclease Cas1 [Methanoregulaceae archaeon]|nr:CRISPR-associated endonuclease Cas1 [Methanoregulaceae archaeon]